MKYNFDSDFLPALEYLPPMNIEDVDAAREAYEAFSQSRQIDFDDSGVIVVDREIPGPEEGASVLVRTYSPEGLQQPVPGLLHIHGGGFVLGSVESEYTTCVGLCRELGIVIVSVEYRLAPETSYPGGLEDCYAALLWVSEQAEELNIDPERLGVIGLSAGGALSAATAILARDRKGPALCFQYLGIPVLDDRLESASMQQFTDTPLWNRPCAIHSWNCYLGDRYQRGADNVPYYAAPLRLEDATGLPPAYISTMEFDPLRDEGLLYGLKLLEAGVQVELHNFPGAFHGSVVIQEAEVSRRELAEMSTVLRRGLKIT